MSSIIDDFIEEARGVTVIEAAGMLGIALTRANYAGPCPACGGKDRFAISVVKQAFNCRQCGAAGRDGISLMALANDHHLASREGLLNACADALGRIVPVEGSAESVEERRFRMERIAERQKRNAEAAAEKDKSSDLYRQREVDKARGIYLQAQGAGAMLATYLHRRSGFEPHPEVFANLRFQPNATYWHGRDDRGFERAVHAGPAQIAPFVNLEGRVTGCHQTWIDLRCPPKLRPVILDDAGEALPTKKMRGTKKGSFIPLFGLLGATRWVGGEGIENGLAIAGAEGFRVDTFYFAAGDLGNLSGPADPKSAFNHPSLRKADARGHLRAIRVQGPEPKPDQTTDEAMPIPDHVDELVLLADGDSEAVFTAAAMARAERRLSRDGRTIETWWPPEGADFANLMGVGA
ncbi:P4 alpha zinc-binding domain-containing protein [Rhizobium sp. Root483D2]|uniref:DUF7146 domain-containing protein n=1 Tax=Rhizobium sp. Root483D2 TaxID=1736545 RepID=UPI000713E9F6|nr:P4 alpha zinc-binding domain-containing protein [Rhizobium sp. Root483D2]KQY31790.1 P4 alpha zinc-binding domain-containing protein [Rhizobium sp. Root483D2]